jgi:hypothetical protein
MGDLFVSAAAERLSHCRKFDRAIVPDRNALSKIFRSSSQSRSNDIDRRGRTVTIFKKRARG